MFDVLDASLHVDSGPVFVERDVDFLLDVVKRLARVNELLDRHPQLDEVSLLSFKQARVGHLAVAGTDFFDRQLLSFGHDANPTRCIAIAGVIESTIHAGIAGEQDAVLGQPGERVARRMSVTEVEQLHALIAVIENHLLRERQRRLRVVELAVFVGFVLLRLLKAGDALGVEELPTVFRGDCRCPLLHEDRIPVGMISVIVRVEDVADRLIGRLADLFDELFGLIRKAGFDHKHKVFEDDPTLIAAEKFWLGLHLAEEDSGSDFGDNSLRRLEPSDRPTGRSNNSSQRQRSDKEATIHAEGLSAGECASLVPKQSWGTSAPLSVLLGVLATALRTHRLFDQLANRVLDDAACSGGFELRDDCADDRLVDDRVDVDPIGVR